MKRLLCALLLVYGFAGAAQARITVVATYPWIADIAARIGGDRVSVQALGRGTWDPHFVAPKPSLIAQVRRADLLIINGAELEIGWLPPVLRDSRNARVQVGTRGFLDLSARMKMIDAPAAVSRSGGDVHPSGNPHYHLGPAQVLIAAQSIAARLGALDQGNRAVYEKNYRSFAAAWKNKLAGWETALAGLKGARVVQYHNLFNYFFAHFGIEAIAELEPLPGIPPSSGHLAKVIALARSREARLIVTDVYHPRGPGRLVSEKTGVRLAVLPHDVGAVPEAKDIISLFDELVRRLAP